MNHPATADIHPFDRAVSLQHAGGDRFIGTTSPHYGNMVGPYGGITAAALLNACCQHPARLGDPVAVTVNYAGPVKDGEFRIDARPTRTNRSTQHWSIELSQHDGDVATTGTAVFAVRRQTWEGTEARFPDHPLPPALDPEARERALKGRMAWLRAYDMRFVHGGFPDPKQPILGADSETSLWVRDEPPRPLDFVSLTAISDCFFPRVYVRLQKVVPAGTVSMTTYFHADAESLARQGDRHVLATARALRFSGGFSDQVAEIWGDEGELLASSHQVVYFKG